MKYFTPFLLLALTACSHSPVVAPNDELVMPHQEQVTISSESAQFVPFPGTSALLPMPLEAELKKYSYLIWPEVFLAAGPRSGMGSWVESDRLLHFDIIPFTESGLTVETVVSASNCDPVDMENPSIGNDSYRFASGAQLVNRDDIRVWRVTNTCNFPGGLRHYWPVEVEECRGYTLGSSIDISAKELWFRGNDDLRCELLSRMGDLENDEVRTVRSEPTSFENEEYIVSINGKFFRIRVHLRVINEKGRKILEDALQHIVIVK